MSRLDLILSHESVMRILEAKVAEIQTQLAVENDHQKRLALLHSWGVILELKGDIAAHTKVSEVA